MKKNNSSRWQDSVGKTRSKFENYSSEDLKKIKPKLREDLLKDLALESTVPFLVQIKKIDENIYRLVDTDTKISKRDKYDVIKYLRNEAKDYYVSNDQYGLLIDFDSKIVRNSYNFQKKWEYSVGLRQSSGVIIQNNKEQILFVFGENKSLNFPMGKEEFNDNKNLKTTALREVKEEVGYPWPLNKVEQLNMYEPTPFKFQNTSKEQRFYYCTSFNDEDNIDPNFSRKEEINGNVWVNISDLRNFFNRMLKYEDCDKSAHIDFNKWKTIKVQMHKQNTDLFTVADSVQNFFIRRSYIRDLIFGISPVDVVLYDKTPANEELERLWYADASAYIEEFKKL